MVNAIANRTQISSVIENFGSTCKIVKHTSYTRDKWGKISSYPGEREVDSSTDQVHRFNNSLIPETGVTPTVAGTITYGSGLIGPNSACFNGTDTDINLGNVYGIVRDVSSYSFWFKPDTTWDASYSTDQAFIGKTTPGQYDFWLGHSSSNEGKVTLTTVNVGTGETISLSSTTSSFSSDSWHHVVVTHDWSTPMTKLYVNGSLEASTTGAMTSNVADTSDFRLGNRRGVQFWYDGCMDELLIFNEVLSDSVITDLYQRGAGVTVKAVPDNTFSFSKSENDSGSLNNASTIVIMKGDTDIEKQYLVYYSGLWYKVVSVQDFALADVSLAKQVGLEELYDNNKDKDVTRTESFPASFPVTL